MIGTLVARCPSPAHPDNSTFLNLIASRLSDGLGSARSFPDHLPAVENLRFSRNPAFTVVFMNDGVVPVSAIRLRRERTTAFRIDMIRWK